MTQLPEYWLRGPIPNYPAALQPVVHAILQAKEEIHVLMQGFPSELLWERPAKMASPAFHLQHIVGVLDRLATYAQDKSLTTEQFAYLKKEGAENTALSTTNLLANVDLQIAEFLELVAKTDPKGLSELRKVGRAQLSSTVGGLLFHAAEHTQRHFGQLLVTVKVIQEEIT